MPPSEIAPLTLSRVLLAACLAPLVVVPLMMVWMLAAQAMTAGPQFPDFSVARALFQGLFLGLFFSLPVAWATTFVIGVPVVVLYLRVFGEVNPVAIVVTGAVLPVGVLFVLEALLARGTNHLLGLQSLTLFTISGMLIAGIAWWIAFGRDEDGTVR